MSEVAQIQPQSWSTGEKGSFSSPLGTSRNEDARLRESDREVASTLVNAKKPGKFVQLYHWPKVITDTLVTNQYLSEKALLKLECILCIQDLILLLSLTLFKEVFQHFLNVYIFLNQHKKVLQELYGKVELKRSFIWHKTSEICASYF